MGKLVMDENMAFALLDCKMRMEQMERYISEHSTQLARTGLLDGMLAILSRQYYSILKEG